MDIEKAREKRKEMEGAIFEIVNGFEEESELVVTNIELLHVGPEYERIQAQLAHIEATVILS